MNPYVTIRPGLRLDEVQRQSSLDLLECRILICHALQLTRSQLISQSERRIDEEEAQRMATLFARRLGGEPIAYLTGQREFYGLDFEVNASVLIPRPETELLVELALARLPHEGSVLDLGTGSGAIAIAIAHARPDAQVSAVDASESALRVAQANAARLLAGRAPLHFLQSDWYGACAGGEAFDLLVANPPYIRAGDPHLAQGDLRFEPTNALTDHDDGLAAIRRIIAGASDRLNPGGHLLIEHGFDQGSAVKKLLADNLFAEVQTWQDLAGLDRVTGGKRQA